MICCASRCAVVSRFDRLPHLAISILLRTVRLIYFKRDNNKTVYNACAKIEPQAVITPRELGEKKFQIATSTEQVF